MNQTTTLAALLDLAAGRDPSGLALRDRGRSLSWSEAAEAAGRLAAALDLVGVGPGDRVGVHYRKSAEAFLAMHAVVQRGAIAVPLDPTASPAYLTSVAHQTGCEVVLTHHACRNSALALAAGSGIGIRALVGLAPDDTDGAGRAGLRPVALIGPAEIDDLPPRSPRAVNGGDTAYLITTSGSTGVPKGISHTHDSAMAYVAFKLAAYDLRPTDRISDIAPNHFDISTLALWVTPAVGAANVVVSEPYQMLPASLSQLAADEAITVWYSVPYLLTQLLLRGDLEQRDLSALRWVLFGGEPFPPQVLGQLMARLPGARFSNVYGPAEVNACTVHHLDGPPDGEHPVPIGLPVGPARVALVRTDTFLPDGVLPDGVLPDGGGGRVPVDPEQAEPEPGRQGELWVSAPTMMAGYWQRPDLDATAIVTGPDGRRWYRTGDLGHRSASGHLVFGGRVDHQVKVRGHRIELEAIEAVLEAAPGVAHAVATVVRPGDGADVVVAGLWARPGAELDVDAIRRHAAGALPAYAVPSRLEPLEATATTGSGKLNRRELRATLTAMVTGGAPAPRSEGGST